MALLEISKYLKDAVKDSLMDYFKNDFNGKLEGVKKFEILDIMSLDEGCDSYGRYKLHVLIKHKQLQHLDNCSAYTLMSYPDFTVSEPKFDGYAWLDDGEFMSHSISYGSFTKEMASEWLDRIEKNWKMERLLKEYGETLD